MDRRFSSFTPAERDRVLANGDVFFPLELPVFATFVPDRGRIQASGVPLSVVLSERNRDSWCAERSGMAGRTHGSCPGVAAVWARRIRHRPRSIRSTRHPDSEAARPSLTDAIALRCRDG